MTGEPYARRLILHASSADAECLPGFVAKCLRDGVELVCVVGARCAEVEDLIDELAVGDASVERGVLTTTSHPHQTIAQVRAFAAGWTFDCDLDEPVGEVWPP